MLAARKRQSAAQTSAQVAIRQTNVVRLLAMLLLAMRTNAQTVTRLAIRNAMARSVMQRSALSATRRLTAIRKTARASARRLATVLRQIAASSLLQEIIEADHTRSAFFYAYLTDLRIFYDGWVGSDESFD